MGLINIRTIHQELLNIEELFDIQQVICTQVNY